MNKMVLVVIAACGAPVAKQETRETAVEPVTPTGVRHTVENGLDVFEVTAPPYCFDKDHGTVCGQTLRECTDMVNMLGSAGTVVDRPCYAERAVACFLMTDVMSGRRDAFCVKDMPQCLAASKHHRGDANVSGVSACFVVRDVD